LFSYIKREEREREREKVLRLFYPNVEISIFAHDFAASAKISKKKRERREIKEIKTKIRPSQL
jgi:hypothetical protein